MHPFNYLVDVVHGQAGNHRRKIGKTRDRFPHTNLLDHRGPTQHPVQDVLYARIDAGSTAESAEARCDDVIHPAIEVVVPLMIWIALPRVTRIAPNS